MSSRAQGVEACRRRSSVSSETVPRALSSRGEALSLVELRDGCFPFRTLTRDIGALLGLVGLRLGAEFRQASLRGLELRIQVLDQDPNLLAERLRGQAQLLQLGFQKLAPLEREFRL